jgi:hypothetical protein
MAIVHRPDRSVQAECKQAVVRSNTEPVRTFSLLLIAHQGRLSGYEVGSDDPLLHAQPRKYAQAGLRSYGGQSIRPTATVGAVVSVEGEYVGDCSMARRYATSWFELTAVTASSHYFVLRTYVNAFPMQQKERGLLKMSNCCARINAGHVPRTPLSSHIQTLK